MVQTIFWLPNHLKQNQLRLEAIAKQYGKDLDPEERAEIEKIFKSDGPLTEEQLNQLLENVKDDTEPKKEAIPAAKPEQKKEKWKVFSQFPIFPFWLVNNKQTRLSF